MPGRLALRLAFVLALAGCGVGGRALDPTERVAGERQRIVQEPMETLWRTVIAALPEEGIGVAHSDRAKGAIATHSVRLTGREAQARLAEIGDLGQARRAGLRRVSELEVRYFVLLAPAGDAATRLRIRSSIDAVDRSESMFFGDGIFGAGPRHVEVASRGVVERELMRRLASHLFTTEEMLFLLGEPGFD